MTRIVFEDLYYELEELRNPNEPLKEPEYEDGYYIVGQLTKRIDNTCRIAYCDDGKFYIKSYFQAKPIKIGAEWTILKKLED